MKRASSITCWAICAILVGEASARAGAGEEEGFQSIFDGESLQGWVVEGVATTLDKGVRKPVWTAADGVLHCRGFGFGFLRHDKPYADFTLRLEYRMSKGCNSGVGIRSVKYVGARNTRPSFAGYEVQIMDDAGQPPSTKGTCSLYRYVAPSSNPVKPAGEWNELEIHCQGPRIRIRLNGQLVQDVDQRTIPAIKDKPLSGYLSLQNHGHDIEFRNLRVREIRDAG